MKRLFLFFLLLAACAQEELPPGPPPVGDTGTAGRAIGGVTISNTTLPSWAGPLLYTDITPARAREGETIKVTVEKPSFVTTKFYVHVFMHFFNKKNNVWEKVSLDAGESGKVTQQWAETKAVFRFSANPNRFVQGNNFLVVYWCIDTDTKDEKGNKIWNCNNRKWGLGAFELLPAGIPELIEQDIGAARFLNSSRGATSEGDEFTAEYQTTTGTKSTVKITKLSAITSVKQTMSQNLLFLQSIWATRAGTCGFLIPGATTTYSWLTNSSRVLVQTSGTTLDESLVSAYSQKYPSNCFLLSEIERISQGKTGFCGNAIVDGDETCDGSTDSTCPGLCRPDCTCTAQGEPSKGICGDFLVQKPNSQTTVENCEPPQKRDPVTGQVVSGSHCFIRDPLTNKVTGTGICNEQCGCVSGTATFLKCGNGNCETGENSTTCKADCPLDTTPPFIALNNPSGTLSTQTTVYNITAHDLNTVLRCDATTANATEPMSRSGINWLLTKTLADGQHLIQFTCTDALNLTSSRNTTVTVQTQAGNATRTTLPDANTSNQTNVTPTA